jgi:SAM-dependent methyltransferase
LSSFTARLENHRLTRALLRRLPTALRRLAFRGSARECPVCESRVSRFLVLGRSQRPNALCPICESQERHRLNWLFIERHTDLLSGAPRSLLHVAPEPILEERFRCASGVDYLSADLDPLRAMMPMDLMDIDLPDEAFDAIFCSHVLEHVEDDRRAMRELWRVLAPGGWALLPVPPIRIEKTVEDPSVVDPAERERRFGQWDHVRRYGRDYADRLIEAGFEVRVMGAAELVGAENIDRFGVGNGDEVFFCRKAPIG